MEVLVLSILSPGQSPLIHALDIALGVVHYSTNAAHDGKSVFVYTMREYMMAPHRDFIEFLTTAPSIRDFCASDADLVEAFNKCLVELKAFRDAHIKMVTRYIIIPSGRVGDVVDGVRGTGGTDLMPFLKQMRDETAEKVL